MIKSWIEAMRLRTLPVSVAGVIAGCGCAIMHNSFKLLPALLCLAFAILAQITSNFANEYFDFKNGIDKKGRAGFRRGVTEGEISPQAMKWATFITFALAALVGGAMIFIGSWWMLLVGVVILLFALAYSAGPYPLSHHGLGDIAVVIFGRRVMSIAYLLSGVVAMLIMYPVWVRMPIWHLAIPTAYLIMHVMTWIKIKKAKGAELNPLLGKTALNLLLFALMFLILTIA